MRMTAYALHSAAPVLREGQLRRTWMEGTDRHFAYMCLPLTIANRAGWEILNPVSFTAIWDGGPSVDSVQIADCQAPELLVASSHFGHGILTFLTGYIFRTEPGHHLWVKGVPNLPKDGATALEGVVESDWLPYFFTMNWQLTRPGLPVRFEAGEPFCFIVPSQPFSLETIEPLIENIEDNPAIEEAYRAWTLERRRFNSARQDWTSDQARKGWLKRYVRGEDATGQAVRGHRSLLKLNPFRDLRRAGAEGEEKPS